MDSQEKLQTSKKRQWFRVFYVNADWIDWI